MTNIARVYADLIRKDNTLMTIEQVPEELRADVATIMMLE